MSLFPRDKKDLPSDTMIFLTKHEAKVHEFVIVVYTGCTYPQALENYL